MDFVPTVYGRIERGDMVPSTPKLRALCELLGVSADVLLGLHTEVSAAPKAASGATSEMAPDATPDAASGATSEEAPAAAPGATSEEAPAAAPARTREEALELRRLTVLVRELPPDRLRLLQVIMEAIKELGEELNEE